MKNSVLRTTVVFICVFILILSIILISSNSDDTCPTGSSDAYSGLVKPVKSRDTTVTRRFGDPLPTPSTGIDFAGRPGTPIYAFADGTVTAAQDANVPGYGGWIVISHRIDDKEYSTIYGHESKNGIFVKPGDSVTAGQKIGVMGDNGISTGPHLHFELIEGNRLDAGKPIDPEPFLAKAVEPESAAARALHKKPATINSDEISKKRAHQIIKTGHSMKIPTKGITLALAVAQVESGLKNLASQAVPESLKYEHDAVAIGDADSVGLFQQRTSQGWGTVKQLMDPYYAASKFYEALMKVPNWESMSFDQAGYAVQRCLESLAYRYEEARPTAEALMAELDDNATLTEDEASHIHSAGKDSPTSGPCTHDHNIPASALGAAIIRYAREQEGQPYSWGGGDFHGPTNGGFDCSGLVLYAVYQATDGQVMLGHNTNIQIVDPAFESIPWEDRQPGDILYFGHPGDYHHTSIYLGNKDGKEMQYEAQDFGVPVGEYPVRFGEDIQVRRLKDV